MLSSNMWLKTRQMKPFWRKLKNTVCYASFFRLHVVSIYHNNPIVVPPTNIVSNKENVPVQQPMALHINFRGGFMQDIRPL